MFRLRSLDHIVLRVEDIERCISFYVEVLGCTVDQRLPEIGLYQLRAGDSIIDIVDVDGQLGRSGGAPPGRTGRNMDHFCLRIEPFDEPALRQHLAHHEVDAGDLRNNWGGDGRGPSIFIHDPAGNLIELKGPPTHPYDPAVGYIPSD
ncbi:MAG: VOC family protein [Acidimicrobiales bacterium]